MIAFSSCRPHSPDSEHNQYQIDAIKSWTPHFERVYYFADREPELDLKNVTFVPSEAYPRIKLITQPAAHTKGWSVLINADIILAPQFKDVIGAMEKNGVVAATSRRYNFDPKISLNSGKLTDYGLDIFICKQEVWRNISRAIPSSFRLGHIKWDGWLSGFLNSEYRSKFADFTNRRVVFHPFHHGRVAPHNHEMSVMDKYMHMASLPARKI